MQTAVHRVVSKFILGQEHGKSSEISYFPKQNKYISEEHWTQRIRCIV